MSVFALLVVAAVRVVGVWGELAVADGWVWLS